MGGEGRGGGKEGGGREGKGGGWKVLAPQGFHTHWVLFVMPTFCLMVCTTILIRPCINMAMCDNIGKRVEFYAGQFAAIQKHQTRERIFHGPVLFIHPCWELNLGPLRDLPVLRYQLSK